MDKLKIVLMTLLVVLLLLVGGVVVYSTWFASPPPSAKPADTGGFTAKEVNSLTWTSPEIRTNLQTGNIALVQFAFLASDDRGLKELQMRHVQVTDLLIRSLQDKKKDELLGTEGLVALQQQLLEAVNGLLQEGEVLEVYTVQKIVQ